MTDDEDCFEESENDEDFDMDSPAMTTEKISAPLDDAASNATALQNSTTGNDNEAQTHAGAQFVKQDKVANKGKGKAVEETVIRPNMTRRMPAQKPPQLALMHAVRTLPQDNIHIQSSVLPDRGPSTVTHQNDFFDVLVTWPAERTEEERIAVMLQAGQRLNLDSDHEVMPHLHLDNIGANRSHSLEI